MKRAEDLDEDGQKKGNRGVIRELRQHRRRRREQGALDDCESIMVDEFIARLGR
jgi:hypothetical protein